MTTLLNPFSLRLEKPPFMEIQSAPIYTDGDFKIYKYSPNRFVHTFKNIVIAERTAPNKTIFSNLKGETKPTGEADIFHQYERPLEAKNYGIEAAKKLNFNIQ